MITTYIEKFSELKAYIDQKLVRTEEYFVEQHAPYSALEKGAIGKLKAYYEKQGFKFEWRIEGENLFIAKVSF
ncbi:hypothetical protein OK024_01380 [Acinetobacter sp. UGAL515B_02]|nr:hypothetical protein [Acinetobacter sp. UGAL515B_02]WON80525.1 hypothetical protein OK024_01380 [Acinetobacter sp. UGAL515B_02]